MMKDYSELTLKNIQKEVVARTNESFHPIGDWSPTDYATCVAGEVGELCNLIKKVRRLEDGDRPYNANVLPAELKVAIGKEWADSLTYLLILAERLELDIDDIMRGKFNEVSERVGSTRRL